jgi:hypothetical protein
MTSAGWRPAQAATASGDGPSASVRTLRRGHRGARHLARLHRARRDLDQPGGLLEAQKSVRVAPLPGQHEAGADIGVAGEGQLVGRGENAHPRRIGRIGGRQHEGGFAEVELPRQRLHVGVRQAARVGEDGQRIAAEAGVGEHVDGDEGVGFH